jgi:hypothetical protein
MVFKRTNKQRSGIVKKIVFGGALFALAVIALSSVAGYP